jgi:hypothetical protein
MAKNKEDTVQGSLIALIRKKGNGGIRPRDVEEHKIKGLRSSPECKQAMDDLVSAGLAEWRKAGTQRAERLYLK